MSPENIRRFSPWLRHTLEKITSRTSQIFFSQENNFTLLQISTKPCKRRNTENYASFATKADHVTMVNSIGASIFNQTRFVRFSFQSSFSSQGHSNSLENSILDFTYASIWTIFNEKYESLSIEEFYFSFLGLMSLPIDCSES